MSEKKTKKDTKPKTTTKTPVVAEVTPIVSPESALAVKEQALKEAVETIQKLERMIAFNNQTIAYWKNEFETLKKRPLLARILNKDI